MSKMVVEADLDFKSRNSYDAGVQLMSCRFYTNSVHCFYYSVLQLMKYKLANLTRGALSYQQQEEKRNLYRTSTHEWLFNEIRSRISNSRQKVNFYNDFKVLRDGRIEADYGKSCFDQIQSVECRSAADRLIAKLNNL